MNLTILITHLCTLITLSFGSTAFSAEHTKDSEADVKKHLANGSAILLDVREVSEWDMGRLNKSVNVPLSKLKAGKGSEGLPQDKIIYVHCQSGRRVLPAADLLKTAGFKDVRALPWGYPELVKMKFE